MSCVLYKVIQVKSKVDGNLGRSSWQKITGDHLLLKDLEITELCFKHQFSFMWSSRLLLAT